MKLKSVFYVVFLGLIVIRFHAFAQENRTISVAGQWTYALDSLDVGLQQQWFDQSFKHSLRLPGSLNEQNIGNPITLKTPWTASIYDSSFYYQPRLAKYRQSGNIKIPFWLTPNKYFVGPVWYQKTINIPENWDQKDIQLFLERAHTETILWVDGKRIGMRNSLVAPHIYDLGTTLKPGKHVFTLRIDNRIKDINVGKDSHSITDQTQGNWNGLIGKLELISKDIIFINKVVTYPDIDHHLLKVNLIIQSLSKIPDASIVRLDAKSFNSSAPLQHRSAQFSKTIQPGVDTLTLEMNMGSDPLLWDEFHPNLYHLNAQIITKNTQDELQTSFGMRKFSIEGKQFLINNRPVFLRGTVENCVFPLTGYPPMDEPSWERIFRIAKAYGLNHMRFHSYCPPEAAFEAADKIGFYLQPEGPSWANHGSALGYGKPIDQYIYDETNRMDDFYGNYASFCMMAYGNEPRGRQVEYLTAFNNYWKAKDNRHVYTGASVGGSWPVIPNNEYMVRAGARGLDWNQQPESYSTYENQIKQFQVPFVAHEMGQYCVFPDFKEIPEYTGAYHPKNLELFQEDLKDHHLADQAQDFLMASGKLQVLCYKNEIEKALRTPGYSGYQLLSLNDYTGQGTALVGVLNPFWNDKGYLTAPQFRKFNQEVVPLASFHKFVFTNDERAEVQLQLANFSTGELQAEVDWSLKDDSGHVVQSGKFPKKLYEIGHPLEIGSVNLDLSSVKKAAKLNFSVQLKGTNYQNDWDIWVYPTDLPKYKTSFYYTTGLDAHAKKILDEGGNVFLNASGKVIKGKEVVQTFLPVFWNTSWFKMRPPHTLGILLDPKHPAFKDFPTSYHSDLQWWKIVNKSQVMNLEDFPVDFKPLVQPIDTWFMNRRLALIFEARVGKGKIMVSSADLSPDLNAEEPAARQLFYSLQRYMQSDAFQPKFRVDFNTINDIFKTGSREVFDTFTKDSPDELKPKNK